MPNPFPKNIFVTGTDTDVGKTVVSSSLVLGLRAAYFKPVQSGTEPLTDTESVKNITGLPVSHFLQERFLLRSPLSPHAAAKIDRVHIRLSDFDLPDSSPHPHLVVEGAGGVLVPLNEEGDLYIDLLKQWKLPTIIVARSTLGTINHTLLTLNELRRKEIPLLGVVLNGPKNEGNKQAIQAYGNIPVLGEIEPQSPLTPKSLHQLFEQIQKALS